MDSTGFNFCALVQATPQQFSALLCLISRCYSWCTTTSTLKRSTMQSVCLLLHMFGWLDLVTSLIIMWGRISVSEGLLRCIFTPPLVPDSLYWSFPNVVTPLTDDVAPQFLCYIVLHCPEQWLYTLLYLPYAHPFHPNGLWCSWNSKQI